MPGPSQTNSGFIWAHCNATAHGGFATGENADVSLHRDSSAGSMAWVSADDHGCALAYTPGVPMLYAATLIGGMYRCVLAFIHLALCPSSYMYLSIMNASGAHCCYAHY